MDFTLDVDLPQIKLPCPKLPAVGGLPSIPLMGGAELKAFLDFASGYATDCKLSFNLLIQLGPLFASMACLMKILGVFKLIPDFLGAVTQPWKLPGIIPNIIKAITDLLKCFPPLAIPQVILMIMAIIELIIKFLMCLIEQIMSIINILSNIDISIAFGNDALSTALGCAQDGANNAFANVMMAIEAILPIIAVIMMLIELAGGGVTMPPLPDLSALRAIKDPAQAAAAAQDAVNMFQQAHASLEAQRNAILAQEAAASGDSSVTETV